MEDTPGPAVVNGSVVHNFIWADDEIGLSRTYPILVCPLALGLVGGVGTAMGLSRSASEFKVIRRLWNDAASLYTLLALVESNIVWACIFLNPYFASEGVQIAMFVVLFAGPPVLSYLLLARPQVYRDMFDLSLSKTRESMLNEFGVKDESISCDAISSLLFPISYILIHIVFAAYCLMALILVTIFWVLVITVTGLLALFSLQRNIQRSEEGYLSPIDLLYCILIYLGSFSIPELVLVLMNINLPNSPESAGLTIAFIVVVGLEGLFGIFYLMKWIKFRNGLPRPPETSPANIVEVPVWFEGVQMTHPSASTGHTVKQEAQGLFLASSTTGQRPTKILDDNDDDDFARLSLIKSIRDQNGKPAKASSQQQQSPLHTDSMAPQENDVEMGSDALECPICYMTGIRKKVIVSCGHMLCEKCLEGLKTRTGSNLCPFCNQEITQTTDLYF